MGESGDVALAAEYALVNKFSSNIVGIKTIKDLPYGIESVYL